MHFIAIRELSQADFEDFLEREPAGSYELADEFPAVPGKWERAEHMPLAERLYEQSLEGGADDESGESTLGDFSARIGRFVIFENSDGFVTYDEYPDADTAAKAYEKYLVENGERETV